MGYAYTVPVRERHAFSFRSPSGLTVATVLSLLAAAGAAIALALPHSAAPPARPTLLTPVSTTPAPR
jgi:hypothetical protein